jgi:hypothetical protein
LRADLKSSCRDYMSWIKRGDVILPINSKEITITQLVYQAGTLLQVALFGYLIVNCARWLSLKTQLDFVRLSSITERIDQTVKERSGDFNDIGWRR